MHIRTDDMNIAITKKLIELMSAVEMFLDKIEAEKICLTFYRDNVAETDTERNNFNNQLLLLEGAKQLSRLVFVRSNSGKYDLYHQMLASSHANIDKDSQFDDAFVQVVHDLQMLLNKNDVAPGASEEESEFLELRRKNLEAILEDYSGLQKRAMGTLLN